VCVCVCVYLFVCVLQAISSAESYHASGNAHSSAATWGTMRERRETERQRQIVRVIVCLLYEGSMKALLRLYEGAIEGV
jgi:hypothetical protein